MKIGLLGSGSVGKELAKGFLAEGHEVWIATREPEGEKGTSLKTELSGATVTDFATAAKEAELAILCVKWEGAGEMIKLAGPENLDGKIVIDTSNLIAQEDNTLVYAAPATSGGEQVQAWLPNSKVVKAFNTVGAQMMYKPEFEHGMPPTMFMAGDDKLAKEKVTEIIALFGWEALDAGGIIASRHLEPMALVWINYSISSGDRHHALKML